MIKFVIGQIFETKRKAVPPIFPVLVAFYMVFSLWEVMPLIGFPIVLFLALVVFFATGGLKNEMVMAGLRRLRAQFETRSTKPVATPPKPKLYPTQSLPKVSQRKPDPAPQPIKATEEDLLTAKHPAPRLTALQLARQGVLRKDGQPNLDPRAAFAARIAEQKAHMARISS